MGLFGGSKSYSGSGQKWAQPIAKQAAGQVQGVFSAAQPQLEKITQGVTSLLPGISENYQSWTPQTDAAKGYYGDVLSGKFLDPSSNPGLASLLNRNTQDVTNGVNSQFSMAGRYGSGAHTGVLTRELADSNGAILADQYNRERATMDSAASTVPQLQAGQLAQLLQGSELGAELPYTGTNSLASSLAALFSGGKSKTSAGIGGLLGGAGSIMSGLGAMKG